MTQQIIDALKQLRNQYQFAITNPYRFYPFSSKVHVCSLCNMFRGGNCKECPWTRFYYQQSIKGINPCMSWIRQWQKFRTEDLPVDCIAFFGFFSLRDPERQSPLLTEIRQRRIQMLNAWIKIYEEDLCKG